MYHCLPKLDGRIEEVVDRFARELQRGYALGGEIVPFPECQKRAFGALQDMKLVCYVTEDNGDYRPLDGRIVEKLQRMDHMRQNLGIGGWRQLLQARAAVAQVTRQKAQQQVWDDIRRDDAFRRVLMGVLSGVKTRSIVVPEGVPLA